MKTSFTLLFLLFIAETSFSQKGIEADKQQIKNLISESFQEVFSNLNAKQLGKFYTDDFLILEDGVIWNRDTIVNYVEKRINANLNSKTVPIRANRFEFIDIKIAKEMAWVAYQNYAVWKQGATTYRNAHWLESATAIKTADGWRLQMLHSTPVRIK